jgi:menaquinol-cytochrome c reductase cytochrome b subunit
MNLLATIPLGGFLRDFLVPDDVGQPMSLLRFYVLHVAVIPLCMLILCGLHFYRIRKDKGVLPYL